MEPQLCGRSLDAGQVSLANRISDRLYETRTSPLKIKLAPVKWTGASLVEQGEA